MSRGNDLSRCPGGGDVVMRYCMLIKSHPSLAQEVNA